jgi:flavodoxin
MKAIVVYESHWGNTAAVARAIADGIGSGARALTTDEAVGHALTDVDLVVAGAPVMVFSLPGEGMRDKVEADRKAPAAPDVAHPVLRTWLDSLPAIPRAKAAAFDTRMRLTPRGAVGTIESKLRKAGCQVVTKGKGFVVTGTYGPLREGELDRARAWGAELAAYLED